MPKKKKNTLGEDNRKATSNKGMFGVGRSLYFWNILKTNLEMQSECPFRVHV